MVRLVEEGFSKVMASVETGMYAESRLLSSVTIPSPEGVVVVVVVGSVGELMFGYYFWFVKFWDAGGKEREGKGRGKGGGCEKKRRIKGGSSFSGE